MSNTPAPASSCSGRPPRTTTGSSANSPMSIIEATTELAQIIRLDRDEQSVEAPKQKAAPIPPRIASNGLASAEPGDKLTPETLVIGPGEEVGAPPVRRAIGSEGRDAPLAGDPEDEERVVVCRHDHLRLALGDQLVVAEEIRPVHRDPRSEERRVGKECRSRW